MNESDVREMARTGVYRDHLLRGTVEETHISWVILTPRYAFKIKKPLLFPFLDYSTLSQRKAMCEKELELNRRFTDIYLAVLPIHVADNRWTIGGDDAPIVEYCVVMRRMASSKRLDNVVRNGVPPDRSIAALAASIASFHERAVQCCHSYQPGLARQTFRDLESITDVATSHLGKYLGEIIRRAVAWSDDFLDLHARRLAERTEEGWIRDVHGDLHCGNIFLYARPVLFDCIEFNDEYRRIDVLYELAFLCMDLERFHQRHFSSLLLREYERRVPAFRTTEDRKLFVYYKAVRANIRAKVHAIRYQQAKSRDEASVEVCEMRRYLGLMNEYVASMHGREF